MANKALESTVLSIEVQSGSDKDGNPTFTKKKIGNLVANAAKDSRGRLLCGASVGITNDMMDRVDALVIIFIN